MSPNVEQPETIRCAPTLDCGAAWEVKSWCSAANLEACSSMMQAEESGLKEIES